MLGGFRALLNKSQVTQQALPNVHQQVRLGHRTLPKPKPRVRINLDGELMINTDRLVNLHRWTKFKIARMWEYVHARFQEVRGLPEGERIPQLQRTLNDYMAAYWGSKLARRRRIARTNRKYRMKRRADTKLARKNMLWQRVQDMKESKVLSDRARQAREERGEQFSFRKFLAEYRESKKVPFVIHDEVTFEKYLEEQKQKAFFKGPSSSRQPLYDRAGYKRRYKVEILDPLIYELKRKGFITQLVEKRENAIKEKKVQEELAIRRAAKAERKAADHAKRTEYWGKVLGDWHRENARLVALKREYFMAREDIFAESRREFLVAMNQDVHLWTESPDECKFMRFHFHEGVTFPFNRTPYQ